MKRVIFAGAVLHLLFSAWAFAQTANSTLGGSVADSTGALIPGVSIKATNTETGIVNTAVSNEAGVYQLPSLQAGTYSVTAELPGFQTQVVRELKLAFSQQARLNFTMQVSTVSTSVDVSVPVDTLLASSSSVGTI